MPWCPVLSHQCLTLGYECRSGQSRSVASQLVVTSCAATQSPSLSSVLPMPTSETRVCVMSGTYELPLLIFVRGSHTGPLPPCEKARLSWSGRWLGRPTLLVNSLTPAQRKHPYTAFLTSSCKAGTNEDRRPASTEPCLARN